MNLLVINTLMSQNEGLSHLSPPGSVPKIFAPGVISTDSCEFAVTFSNDGKELFFTRRPTYDGSGNKVMYSRLVNGRWTIPVIAQFSKKGYIEFEPYYSPDRQRVYFHSEREHPITGKKMINDEKIWYSDKISGIWTTAKYLNGSLNNGWVMGVAPACKDILYLCGEVNGLSGVLKSNPENGEYNWVERIIDGVHPFVSPDESFMIFDVIGSNWEQTELYISYKKNGKWEIPLKLPEIINSTKTECFGRMSPDGKYFFFNRKGDIYWVEAKVIGL